MPSIKKLYIFLSIFIFAEFANATETKIAVITELSGPGAAIGRECQDGAEIAISAFKDSGPHRFSLLYGDSQDSAKTAISEFNKLTRADAADVVIVSRSKIALPLNPLSKRNKIPVVGVSAHPDFTNRNPYSVRVYPNAEKEGAFIAEHSYKLGKRRIAVVTVEDEWNLSVSNSYLEKFRALGGEVVYHQDLSPSDNEFSTIVTSIKTKEPDGLFLNLQIAQLGAFIKKLREQGINTRVFSNYWIQKQEVISVAGVENIENSVFGEVDIQRPKFLSAAKVLYPDKTPTPATYTCYVAVGSIIEATRKIQGEYSRDSLRESLVNLQSVTLLDETIPFNNREIQYQLKLREIRSGQPH